MKAVAVLRLAAMAVIVAAAVLQPMLLEGLREEAASGAFIETVPPQDIVLTSLGLAAAIIASALIVFFSARRA